MVSKTFYELFSDIAKSEDNSRRVFVVHGRNIKARDALFIFLRSINLKPFDLVEVIPKTGKGTPYIGEVLAKAFSLANAVIVLMTPDDEGRLREPYVLSEDENFEKELTPQARPNVLFEAGMALGKNPALTILIELGKLRPFSDISGRHLVKLDDTIEKRRDLANRLKSLGCQISLKGTDWHTSGKFEESLQETGIIMRTMEQRRNAEILPSREMKPEGMLLLPDSTDITKLNVGNDLLHKLYKQAYSQAIDIYRDAKLNGLTIQVFPFEKTTSGRMVKIYFNFFSKWVDKICGFRFSNIKPQVVHTPPDRSLKKYERRDVFTALPWNKDPHWMQFLNFTYIKKGPFAEAIGTNYHIHANPPQEDKSKWTITFYDGFKGQEYRFDWTGGKINDQNIKEFEY